MSWSRSIVLLLLVTVVSFAGCGGDGAPADLPDRAPVTVTVKHNGQTVAEADVSFHPVAADGKAAYGLTGADGTTVLTTYHGTQGDGAIPGDYTVTVEKLKDTSGGGGGADEGEETDDPEVDEDAPAADPVDEHLLPEKYADPETSDLKATVPDGGDDFEFDLKD